MARAGDEAMSSHTDRLRSILAGLEYSCGERRADLREQARQAIADIQSARQRTVRCADTGPGSDESVAR